MNRKQINFRWLCRVLLITLVLVVGVSHRCLAQYYPVHATVQWPSAQSPHLFLLAKGSQHIHGFQVRGAGNGELVEEFSWNGKTYSSGNKAIEGSPGIVLTYNTGTSEIHTRVYRTSGDKERLESIGRDTPPEEVVKTIHQCCLSSLRTLPFSKLSEYITRIASQKALKEESELAVLRLMNAVGVKGSSADFEGFVETFGELYKAAPVNSMKPLDELADDFAHLINRHLDDFLQRGKEWQLVDFLTELMQSPDKFKAGATTLEVIRNNRKYIPPKYSGTLSGMELEDLITRGGNFRFDIKWKAIDPKTKRSISIFVDTKNYSSANNMFRDLGQFKAYLSEIGNFDRLYIVQQGGRGVIREQVIAQLEKAIAKDAQAVFKAKKPL